jgi:hypothetical protein
MSVGAGSGETGPSIGHRLRSAAIVAGWIGYLIILLALTWVAWGAVDQSWSRESLPNWYLAPAQVASADTQRAAARAMCTLAVLANSDIESGWCRDAASAAEGTACFAATRNSWCTDGRVPVATALWLLLAGALLAISMAARRPQPRPIPAAERHRQLKKAFLNAAVSLFMLGWGYHSLLLKDVAIFDHKPLVEETAKDGCAIRTGPCVLDLSSKTPAVLMLGQMGIVMLADALQTGYRRRRDFFYRPVTSSEKQK